LAKKVPDILQGSVARFLRDGGIFDDDFVANLLASLHENNVENRSTFGEVTARNA